MSATSELQNEFWRLLLKSPTYASIFDRSQVLPIPNWGIGAGFIAQTIWNLKHGYPINQNIRDVDWVYFDPSDLSEEAEKGVTRQISLLFADLPLKFDVKNQARVHLWYESKFGYPILPYADLESAIKTWPTTATAIAVGGENSEPRLYAPFGLADLLQMKIRANQRQITEEIYLKKTDRWKQHWPKLEILPWERT